MIESHEAYWMGGAYSEFSDVSLIHAGRVRRNAGYNYIFGGYHCWHIVSGGRGYVISQGKKYILEKGDLFSVMEDCEIEYGADSDDGWEFHYLRVDGPMAKQMTEHVGFTPATPVVRTEQKDLVLSRFKEILGYAKDHLEYGPEFFAGHLFLLYQILRSNIPVTRRVSAVDLVTEAEKIIRDPFNNNINVNELAAMLHISRSKLFMAYKEVTGASPLVSLQKVRLEFICKYLADRELTLAQVAQKSAFPNEKYLIRFFRKYMGMTPGKYRRSVK